jgi:hypothetical protein
MSRLTYLCLGVSAAVVAGCTPAANSVNMSATAAPRPCFSTDQISNFRSVDGNTLYVRARGSGLGVYEIASTGGCAGLELANQLSVSSVAPTGSRVCVGDAVNLTTPGSAMNPGQCQGRITRAMTQSEVEALQSRSRP